MTPVELYKKYFLDNSFEREHLWELLAETFDIERAIYPGSFIHITPSFHIPSVAFIDSDRQAKKFFAEPEGVMKMNNERKAYKQSAEFKFLPLNYTKNLDLEEKSFDLMISKYAGIMSQCCKKYLRKGGILLANNSHGDAGVAYLDNDYELVGVVNATKGKFRISNKNLDKYFKMKSGKTFTMQELIAKGKGVGYAHTSPNYLFRLKV